MHPEKIIIFGSYARGEATEDSDIDIYVIVRDDQATDINTIAKARFNLRKALKDTIIDFDFILQTNKKFEDKKNLKGSI